MHIYLLTSVYPSKYAPKGTTPVVHYFTKEWVQSGHTIHVFHLESVFPKVFYLLGKLFKKKLDSRLGHLVPTQVPKEYDEIKDGVRVTHISLKKTKPHGRFSKKQIDRAFDLISSCIGKENLPDCFVGHWDNPQLELLHLLKEKYKRPSCIVYHSNRFSHLLNCYGEDTEALTKDIDLVGFRNVTAQKSYEKLFGVPAHTFIAASGVSKPFILAGESFEKKIKEVRSFVFVGALIQRKYPTIVIDALHQSYQQEPFKITYIGEGDDNKMVTQRFEELGCKGDLIFTGRIPREEVIQHLKESDVFVMISKSEVFGLVYLEAMALGCITIGARHEGIDGIIEDGVNGFLCKAGDADELASVIDRIRKMSSVELNAISQKAKDTARFYTDVNVAKNYIDELSKIKS